ncbi:hypothetical protein I5677_15580 [Mobilitalea sibirica]|uniref:Uncharacterized protein n=1 Tax=Mobilitalea sibirica TaxID=1462919 RepID=A0A8J7HDP1_9FIRM|nr:hypothetical protein [Mobilitalea sibirica]MBH1942322.1 hypothetical protein [Mobilitalea sibirica]
MTNKNWKKRLRINLIVLGVIILLILLAILSSGKQLDAWNKDGTEEYFSFTLDYMNE